jgi:hypothetical protein
MAHTDHTPGAANALRRRIGSITATFTERDGQVATELLIENGGSALRSALLRSLARITHEAGVAAPPHTD